MKSFLISIMFLVLFSSVGFSQCNGNICKAYNTMTLYSGASLTINSGATFSNAGTTTLTGDLNGAIGTFTGVVDIDGQVTMGADGTVSTVTSTGNATFHGAVVSATVESLGALKLNSHTNAEILALTPSQAGEIYFCSDCAVTVCISTGTGVGAFVNINSSSTACGS